MQAAYNEAVMQAGGYSQVMDDIKTQMTTSMQRLNSNKSYLGPDS